MTEESPSRIRPIWLFGGGAALGIVALCGLVSLCGLGALVWLSLQDSSQTRRATPVAAAETQPAFATLTPLPATPTQLPVLTTPLPTPLPLLTQNPSSRPAPEQAVRTYYQLVSDGRFDASWPLLTDGFKQKFNCCAPNYDYSGYVNWWNSVGHVEFGNVSTVSQNGDQAVVYAEIYFVMNNGARSSVDSNPYIQLTYDAASGNWRFNDKRGSP
jgi:hypothetical protein